MKEIFIPEAIVIDWDRTMGSVDLAVDRLYNTCGIDTAIIKEARTKTENDGGSFDPLRFVQEALTPEQLELFYDRFVHTKEEPPIMYPDVMPFLQKLEEQYIYYIVLTYGKNRAWQMLKARAGGYTGPLSVVNHTDKGAAIAEHKQADGSYRFIDVPNDIAFVARTVSLIDDKADAFKSLPSDCSGFLIQRSEILLPSQQGEIAEHVSVIKSFDELDLHHGFLVKKSPVLV